MNLNESFFIYIQLRSPVRCDNICVTNYYCRSYKYKKHDKKIVSLVHVERQFQFWAKCTSWLRLVSHTSPMT